MFVDKLFIIIINSRIFSFQTQSMRDVENDI